MADDMTKGVAKSATKTVAKDLAENMVKNLVTNRIGATRASAGAAGAGVDQVRLAHRLYFRIYLALLLSLALAAALFIAAWRFNPDAAQVGPSLETFAEFAAEILPPASESDAVQQAALTHWQPRVRSDLALHAADGHRIAAAGRPLPPLDPLQTSSGWLGGAPPVFALKLPDGRWVVGQRVRGEHRPRLNLAAALTLIALAIGIGAYPVVRRLTRRLERLQVSVEALGAGQLSARVTVQGEDEVARLASSFNRSATLIEALVSAQKTLLANASHELRSPLARIRMAIALMETAPHAEMQEELTRNVIELDQLIDEILLASRLDAAVNTPLATENFDLTAMLTEECQRVDATLDALPRTWRGDPRLLRRMVRNLLENARRHGHGSAIDLMLSEAIEGTLVLSVCDRGPGVVEAERENIFTPFYRVPGARERDGSVGLGLSLVRQIARRHGGGVTCLGREGGGSRFVVTLPRAAAS
jgi:signal transduction histidine kinase